MLSMLYKTCYNTSIINTGSRRFFMGFKTNQNLQIDFFNAGSFLVDRQQSMLEHSWCKLFADKIFPKINEQPYQETYSKKVNLIHQ